MRKYFSRDADLIDWANYDYTWRRSYLQTGQKSKRKGETRQAEPLRAERERDMITRRALTMRKTRTRSLYLLSCNATTLMPVFRFKRHAEIKDQKTPLADVADCTYDLIMRIFGTGTSANAPLCIEGALNICDSQLFSFFKYAQRFRTIRARVKQIPYKFLRCVNSMGGESFPSDRNFRR